MASPTWPRAQPSRILPHGPMVTGSENRPVWTVPSELGHRVWIRNDTRYAPTTQRHFFNLRGPSSHIHAKSLRVGLHAYMTHLHRRDQHAALRSDGHDHCGDARPARTPIRRRGSSTLRPRRLAWLEGKTRSSRQSHRLRIRALAFEDEAIGLPANGRESQRGVLRRLCPHGCSVIRTPCFQSRAALAPARVEGVG